MNKKLIHLITNKLPVISVIILILAYIYISIPDNYIVQFGGANNLALPKRTPFIYKFRWVLVILPILLFIHLIYSIYFTQVYAPSLTLWDLGKEFFKQFQVQIAKAVALKGGVADSLSGKTEKASVGQMFNYKTVDKESKEAINDNDLWRLYNIIQLTGDPLSAGYNGAQYFCNAFRPCDCCSDPEYVKWFTTSSYDMKKYCSTQQRKIISPSK
jgi:hypothetical protein